MKLSIGDVEVYVTQPFSLDETEEANVWSQATAISDDTYDTINPQPGREIISR